MATAVRWTSADLEAMPDDGKRYEIIDGELYVSKQPHYHHRFACSELLGLLREWNLQTDAGIAIVTPGLVFGDGDDVVPDLVWISKERLATSLDEAGRFRSAPELVIEVLSPGSTNERRDREAKLKLYSQHGVQEYWIVGWRKREVEVYRRERAMLRLSETLFGEDTIQTPLLPGFAASISRLFPAQH